MSIIIKDFYLVTESILCEDTNQQVKPGDIVMEYDEVITITEDVEIELDGKKFLLEAGDTIVVEALGAVVGALGKGAAAAGKAIGKGAAALGKGALKAGKAIGKGALNIGKKALEVIKQSGSKLIEMAKTAPGKVKEALQGMGLTDGMDIGGKKLDLDEVSKSPESVGGVLKYIVGSPLEVGGGQAEALAGKAEALAGKLKSAGIDKQTAQKATNML